MDFVSQEVLPGVHHIEDPLGGVHMTLLVGSNQALLMDAGYGALDVQAFIRTLTPLPLNLVLSHGHHDHALGAIWFDRAFMAPEDLPILAEYTGPRERRRVLLRSGLTGQRARDFLEADLPAPRPFPDAPFDLGGLTVSVIPVPGHTPGSVALLVKELKLLLLGDSWNPQTWVFFPEALPVAAYAASFKSLMQQPFDLALAPHKKELVTKEYLLAYAKGLTENGLASAKPFVVPGHERVPTLACTPVQGARLIFKKP